MTIQRLEERNAKLEQDNANLESLLFLEAVCPCCNADLNVDFADCTADQRDLDETKIINCHECFSVLEYSLVASPKILSEVEWIK